tara:strand:- start:5076 stop:6239 length:1164 start_codon:yes stop_codon:yes gene_type:complete
MYHKKILLSEPNIIGNENKYLKECIKTNWISSAGKFVDKFEKSISKYTGAKYAISCINGTCALDLSLKIAGVQFDDEVIVPTLTFIAPVNTVIYNNAFPIFMDSDKYFNIDAEKCIDFIKKETLFKSGYTYNKKTGRKISAIIPVHVWGNAVFLDDLLPICKERNIKIIEDASESLGTFYKKGKYKKKHTGTLGTLGCLSFNGNKIISSAGGGMIITNNSNLAEKAKYYSTQAKNDPIFFIHNNVGYNYRMSNINSAIGLAQLENIDFFLKNKLEIRKKYKKELDNINGLSLHQTPEYSINNNWLNILNVNKKIYNKSIKELISLFKRNNIQTRPVWFLNHKQKMYKDFQKYNIDYSLKLINNSLCLPSSSGLKLKSIKKIIKLLYE